MKKLLSLLLAILIVISIIPFTAITALAEATPIATATLQIGPSFDCYMTEPAPDEFGWASRPRQYALTNVKDADTATINEIPCVKDTVPFVDTKYPSNKRRPRNTSAGKGYIVFVVVCFVDVMLLLMSIKA